jgi:REP element-mobilizing transposase RayT
MLWRVILASHVIFTAYGFWLPNDPRGSWSYFVGSWELFRFGKATTVNTTASRAHFAHSTQARLAAKTALSRPPVQFTGAQAVSIAFGFASAVEESKYVVHACCIPPEHVHMVIRDHPRPVRRIVGHLKTAAARQLRSDSAEKVWARNCWAVYLDSPSDIQRAIRYVENNPIKECKRKQSWSLVTPFPGWCPRVASDAAKHSRLAASLATRVVCSQTQSTGFAIGVSIGRRHCRCSRQCSSSRCG